MNLNRVDKYNNKLTAANIDPKENIARIIKEFRTHYPELSHYKRIPGSVVFDRGTELIQELFYATAPMWLSIYKQLNLASRYEMIGDKRQVLITSDDMLGLVYLELPRIMMIINYEIDKSPVPYFKSRMRMLASTHYGVKDCDMMGYDLEQEEIEDHNNLL